MVDGVTIGQAASFAGVTVKTVRHYHKVGLVEEPERDRSGYRRYDSTHLLRLVRVRALAAAGVPLAEITALLDADPDALAAGLADVERTLAARIEELTAQAAALRRLGDGDRALLPDAAVALLDRMPGLGFPATEVAAAREGMVLARALVPERFDDYVADVTEAVDDPAFVALIHRGVDTTALEPDDPRVAEYADAMADHLLAHPERLRIVTGLRARSDAAARYELIAHHGEVEGTAVAQGVALVENRLRSAGVRIPAR
ncbi:MerR family transcriptional regulator [Isoptericola sp. NPDC056618]|uniref:MerR family transcriptional regulator n=1 Tax=unclassified Isoptericola TaxID=2623355 RepID=UPI003660ADF9